jgi:hypothetical protein
MIYILEHKNLLHNLKNFLPPESFSALVITDQICAARSLVANYYQVLSRNNGSWLQRIKRIAGLLIINSIYFYV